MPERFFHQPGCTELGSMEAFDDLARPLIQAELASA